MTTSADLRFICRRRATAASAVLLLAGSGLLGACSAKTDTAGPVAATSPSTAAPSTTEAAEPTTSAKAPRTTATTEPSTEATDPSPTTCRTVDIGGLTVVVPCDADVPDPETGLTLTADSVYGLPGATFDELSEVDATNRVVATEDGKTVIIYLLGSDTLFDVGSSTVKPTAEAALPTVVESMTTRSPNGKILVRGFTDSTGSAADNQTLSERRATAMVDWLAAHGVSRSRMEPSGYGSTRPAAEETSDAGTALNRRIELVVVG